MTIDCLEKEAIERIGYAKESAKRAVVHKLLRHNGNFCCDFAGRLFVEVIKFRDSEEHKIRISDSDDFEVERIFKNRELAMKAFDEFFPDSLVLDAEAFAILARYGFH